MRCATARWTDGAPLRTALSLARPAQELTCDVAMLKAINVCSYLMVPFDCTECGESSGTDLPAFIGTGAPENAVRAGLRYEFLVMTAWAVQNRCVVNTLQDLSCSGSYKHSYRLCTCA